MKLMETMFAVLKNNNTPKKAEDTKIGKKKRVGYCYRCGNCCHGRPLYDSLMKNDDLPQEVKLAITFLDSKIDDMNCPHCVYKGGVAFCSQYPDRPHFCKSYPEVEGDLIKGCGFKFIPE